MKIQRILNRFVMTAAIVSGLSTQAIAGARGIDELNELLKGELSAVETYNQALGKFKESASGDILKSLRVDHEDAVKALTAEVQSLGGVPATSSGAWGVWAKTVTGGAKMIGEDASLKALKEGEEHGMSEYKETLDDEDVPETFKQKVRDVYVPQSGEHIKKLDTQIAKVR